MGTKRSAALDDLDAPLWLVEGAEELKTARPRWAKTLPPISLRDGRQLAGETHPWLLGAIVSTEAESAKHDLIDLLKRHADAVSLDSWMAAALKAWLDADAPARDAWLLTGAGLLGGDATVRTLHDAVRKWSRDKDRALAVLGVDALGRIGTKTALQEVATLSAGIRDHGVADEAQHLMGRKAKAQGTTREAIEDRHVTDFGLDRKGERILSYGARSFRAVLGKDLVMALFGEDDRKRASLPPIAKTDDPTQAEMSRAVWTEMKTGVKRVVKAQLRRFEQAMITGRTWSLPEFREHVLGHTIVSRIAQLLVWQVTGDHSQGVRVTEDFAFASTTDQAVLLEGSEQLRVAHPLRLCPDGLKRWTELFADYGIVQPFQQLARQVHRCDDAIAEQTFLTAPPHAPLKPGVLYGILDNDGWRLGRPTGAHYTHSWKSFVADEVTALISYSGLIVGNVGESPEQTIGHCAFHPGVRTPEQTDSPGKPIRLGLVPPVAFSETMRRLLRLTSEAS